MWKINHCYISITPNGRTPPYASTVFPLRKKDRNEGWMCKGPKDPLSPLQAQPAALQRSSYRGFLTSLAHPSMPSPLLLTGISSFTFSMPFVPSKNS